MIQNESVVIIADNTGAKKGKVIRVMKGSNARHAGIGDLVKIAIKEAGATATHKKGSVVDGLIVRTVKETGRNDGTYVRFSDNAVIIMVRDQKDILKPSGKRIFGPIAREVRLKGYKEVASMAEEVI